MRAPFQVLIIPFIKEGDKYYYAVFKRRDLSIWQFIAGGGEGQEGPVQAMRREAKEEALIDEKTPYIRLATVNTIPAANIHGLIWGEDIIMIPEFTFGLEMPSREIKIDTEHTEYLWLAYDEVREKLKYDSNKAALWELDHRLKSGKLNGIGKNNEIIGKFL
jgi:dihydroneopterin triphosphate diphosphatase